MATNDDPTLTLDNPLGNPPSPSPSNALEGWGQPPPSSDYLTNFNQDTVLQDPNFLNDARKYYELSEGTAPVSDDELLGKFYSDLTWHNVNSIGIAQDLYNASTGSSEMNDLRGRLQQVYQRLPSFWQRGGRGWEGLGQNVAAMAADPVNLIPFGEAFKVAQGVDLAVKAAEAGSGALRSGLVQGGAAALKEGGIMGGLGAAYDAAGQERDQALGLQQGFDWGQLVTSAAIQGLPFAGIAGAAGLVRGGLAAGRRIAEIEAWPEIKGTMVAKARLLDQQAEAAAAANNGDIAAQFSAQADATRAQISQMDQLARTRGATDAQLGIAPAEEAPPEAGPTPDENAAANQQTLEKMLRDVEASRTNPLTDPQDNAILNKQLHNLNLAVNYDQNVASLQQMVNQISAKEAGGKALTPKEYNDRVALQTQISSLTSLRNALIKGAPKTPAEMEQIIAKTGANPADQGYGAIVYGQQAPSSTPGEPGPARPAPGMPAGAGAEPPAPAGAPTPPGPTPAAPAPAAPAEAPPPAAAPAAVPSPGGGPQPVAGGGGGGGGGEAGGAAVEPQAPPEIATATAGIPETSAAEVAAETPAEKRARLKAAKATAEPSGVTHTPGPNWGEVPEGAVLPPGVQVELDKATGKQMARLAPHPLADAPSEVISQEVARLSPVVEETLGEIAATRGYKYAGASSPGKVSMEAVLSKVGYDETAVREITDQIKAAVKGVPATERAGIQREMLNEAVVYQHLAEMQNRLDQAGRDGGPDILLKEIHDQEKNPEIAAVADRILSGMSRLEFPGMAPEPESIADDIIANLLGAKTGREESLHEADKNLSIQAQSAFSHWLDREIGKRVEGAGLSGEAEAQLRQQANKIKNAFFSSSYMAATHAGRVQQFGEFLKPLVERFIEREEVRKTASVDKAESRFGNPDVIYKKDPTAPQRRAGIPSLFKRSNSSGFMGANLGKADVGTVAEARARAEMEGWQEVRALTLKERYRTADGADMKPGETVYFNPRTGKAYKDHLLAAKRPVEEPRVAGTGGQSLIPAVPHPKEIDIAKAAGIDPVAYATRLRDLDPKRTATQVALESETGQKIAAGTYYQRTKNGGIYKDVAELQAAIADDMKKEPPPAPATAAPAPAAAAPSAPTPAATVSPEARQAAEALGQDPAVVQAVLAKLGLLKEGAIPTAPVEIPADTGPSPVPEGWQPQPGRKLSIRNTKTGVVRTLSPSQRTVEEMLGGRANDGNWEIGSNKAEISSGMQQAAKADFIPAGAEPPATTEIADVAEAPKVTDPGDMLTTEQAATTPLATPITYADVDGQTHTLHTALEAAQRLGQLHRAPWPQTAAELQGVIRDIRLLNKAVPSVKAPTAVRAAARQALTDLFSRMAPDQLPLALDALRRIPGVDLPVFQEMSPEVLGGGRGLGVSTGLGGIRTTDLEGNLLGGGVVGLADPARLDADYPLVTVLHHELGHWGYDNILSDEDRLTYLQWALDNFYKDGKLDKGAIARAGFTPAAEKSPQEMFASHFQRWVATGGRMPAPPSLFQKFANYLGKFLGRFFGDSHDIDPAVEQLFAKVMPDPVADHWLSTLGKEGTTEQGKAIVDGIRGLDAARFKLETGLTSGDAVGVDSAIRDAGMAIKRNTEILGRERTDGMLTRLADILRETGAVSAAHDPRLDQMRADLITRGIDPKASWNAMPEGERRLLENHFERDTLRSVGDKVELGDKGEEWTIVSQDRAGDPNDPSFTLIHTNENGTDSAVWRRSELAREGYHAVPQDVDAVTRLALTDNPDPVLARVRAGNAAHDILGEAFAEHADAFAKAENGAPPLRTDNPMSLPTEPLGSDAKFTVNQQDRLFGAQKLLEQARSSDDVLGTEHLMDGMREIGRITGRTGIRKDGSVSYGFGGVHRGVWRRINGDIRARGRALVDEALQAYTDFSAEAERDLGSRQVKAPGPLADTEVSRISDSAGISKVNVTTGSLTPAQREQYDSLIQRTLDFIPVLQKELTRVRRQAEGETRRAIERGTYIARGADKAKAANDAQRIERGRRIAEAAKGKRPRAQDEAKAVSVATPDVPSYKAMSDAQLVDGILKHSARTKTGLQLGAELLSRYKTEPFLPHIDMKTVPNEIVLADGATLGARLKSAIAGGDKTTADQIRKVAFQRAQKQAVKRGIIDSLDATVIASVDREMNQAMGEPEHVGVPEGAPAVVKEMLGRFTHKKQDVQTALRTTMYRLLNLGGITDVANRDGITLGQLYRLAGKEVPAELSPTATVFDIRDPVFSEVRAAMRKLVGNFAEGKGDASENISNMVEMVLRSGLLSDHEYGGVHDAYNLTSDGIKSALEGSRVVPAERRPDAWFADHVAEYLMGQRGTDQLFKPDRNMAAPGFSDVLNEIKATAERVKDATAYVVNGLMHDNMRREFGALTDYGDMFERPRADQLKTNQSPAGMEEQGMLNQHALDPDALRLNSILVNTLANSEESLDLANFPKSAILAADIAEKGGAGPRTNKLVAAGVEGLRTAKGLGETARFNFGHIYKRGSDLMREYNMNWWGDKLNPKNGVGLYHKIQTKGAEYLMPLIKLGHKMPDAPSMLGEYLKRNQFWKEGTQPASHANVVEYLRGMKGRSSLTPQERTLADAYRSAFSRGLKEARDAGVQIGDVGENYFPQVINVEKVRRNMAGATEGWAKYLYDESRSPTSVAPVHLSMTQAREKARDILEGMVNNDGVYMPPKAERRASKADSIDYQRMFRLHETLKDANGRTLYKDGAPQMRYAEAYKLMHPYLHNGLEPVGTKYFAQLARRIVTTDELGVSSHMFFDYMHTMQGGLEDAFNRATDLLTTQKIVRHNFLGQADNGGFEEVTREIPLNRPMTQNEAALAVESARNEMGIGTGKTISPQDIQRGIATMLKSAPEQGQTMTRRVTAIVNAIADLENRKGVALDQGVGRDQYARADAAYRLAMGKPIGSQANIARKTTRLLTNFNSITLLGWTTLSSLTDLMYPLIRTGNLGALARAWTQYAADPVYRDAMRQTGITMEQLAHDRIGLLHGGEATKFSRAFFNLNGLTHWDNLVRELGGAVGWEAFKAEQRRGLRAGAGTRAYRQAEARLQRYGLDHYLKPGAKSLDNADLMNIEAGDPALRQAVVKFVNELVFSHTPDDIPLWAQTPLGKLAFQLKTFPAQMARMVAGRDGVLHQAGKAAIGDPTGSFMPLIYYLTLGTGLGMGVNAIKDLAQARGGPSQHEHALRERKLSDIAKHFGWHPDIHGPVDTWLGNYVEGLTMLGGVGILSDLLYQAGQQADNGSWGYQRYMEGVLGPSAVVPSLAWEGFRVGKDVLTGASTPAVGRSNARTLVGDVGRRIPIFGGNRSVNAWLTSQIAGAPNQKPAGSGWTSFGSDLAAPPGG